jgi:hypothetical protein
MRHNWTNCHVTYRKLLLWKEVVINGEQQIRRGYLRDIDGGRLPDNRLLRHTPHAEQQQEYGASGKQCCGFTLFHKLTLSSSQPNIS